MAGSLWGPGSREFPEVCEVRSLTIAGVALVGVVMVSGISVVVVGSSTDIRVFGPEQVDR